MFPGEIDIWPSTYLEHLGTIFTRFTADTQGSGKISYGVQCPATTRSSVRRTRAEHRRPAPRVR